MAKQHLSHRVWINEFGPVSEAALQAIRTMGIAITFNGDGERLRGLEFPNGVPGLDLPEASNKSP